MSQYIVRKKIVIKAEPAEVWDALTNPQKTKQYFFNCEVSSEWKPGSPITFRGRIFLIKKIEMQGEILQVIPQKLLKYTLKNSSGDGVLSSSTVTDEITYRNGETTLSITDDVGREGEAEKRMKRSEKGWDKVLNGLKEMIEKAKN